MPSRTAKDDLHDVKQFIYGLLVTLFVLTLVVLFPTIRGKYRLHLASWEEDPFVGKPLSELRLFLHEKDVIFGGADPAGVIELAPNQELLQFEKGDEYRWFILGSAVNVGYVIVETRTNGPVIVKIVRGSSVDSL